MSKNIPTDDELLSYLIGDSSQDDREQIEKWLEGSDKNRSRLKTILYFKKEIQSSPMAYEKKTWRTFLQIYAARAGALVMAFAAGLLIQAHWQPLSNIEKKGGIESLSLSEPLSLETQPSGKIL